MKPLLPYKRSHKPGSTYYVRFMVKRRSFKWNTKTDDMSLARMRGKEYRATILSGAYHLADLMKQGRGAATFGELIAAYLALPAPAANTRKKNVASLRVVMAAAGLHEFDRLDRLDPQVVVKYQSACVTKRPGNSSAVISCNGRVRGARSLFSKRCLASYSINVPESAARSFFKIPLLKESEPRRELPSPAAVTKALEALKDRPEFYRVYLLAALAGLRSGEIKEARRDWLETVERQVNGKAEQVTLLHVGGKEFHAKGRRWRSIALAPRVVELLTQSDDPVYLVGPNRHETVNHLMAPLLRSAGFPPKPLQSLRRLAGSRIYTDYGPRQARDFLGHADQRTSDTHYLRSLDAPEPLSFVG